MQTKIKSLARAFSLILLPFLMATCAHAQTPIFQDEFSSTSTFNSQWVFFNNDDPFGTGYDFNDDPNATTYRTHFNGKPILQNEGGLTFVRVPLNSYDNSIYDSNTNSFPFVGKKFLGTEIYSRRGFGPAGVTPDSFVTSVTPSASGFEFETRLRFVKPNPSGGYLPPDPGLVGAYWLYFNHGDRSQTTPGNEYYKSTSPYYAGYEIDDEMLPKQGTNKYHLVNWRNWNRSPARPNPYSNNQYYSKQLTGALTGINFGQWHFLKIRWTPDSSSPTGWRTKWLVKQNASDAYIVMREETQASPDKWMTIRFNLWVPNDDFGDAALDPPTQTNPNPNYPQPANNAATNKSHYLDVDWVKVFNATTPSSVVTKVNVTAIFPNSVVANFNSISGTVTNPTTELSKVNLVIRRVSDNFKWSGTGWVNGNVGVPTNYTPGGSTWTSSGVMPTLANLTAGAVYELKADAFHVVNNTETFWFAGDYTPVAIAQPYMPLNIAVAFNTTDYPAPGVEPINDGQSPPDKRKFVKTHYRDYDGVSDFVNASLLITPTDVTASNQIRVSYNKADNLLWIVYGFNANGTALWKSVGAPGVFNSDGTSIFWDTPWGLLNASQTTVQIINNSLLVKWAIKPHVAMQSPLINNVPVPNNIWMRCTDQAGHSVGWEKRGTWAIFQGIQASDDWNDASVPFGAAMVAPNSEASGEEDMAAEDGTPAKADENAPAPGDLVEPTDEATELAPTEPRVVQMTLGADSTVVLEWSQNVESAGASFSATINGLPVAIENTTIKSQTMTFRLAEQWQTGDQVAVFFSGLPHQTGEARTQNGVMTEAP